MHLLQTSVTDLQVKQEHNTIDLNQKLAERRHVIQDIQDGLKQLQNAQAEADALQAQRLSQQTSIMNHSITRSLLAQQRLELKIDKIEATTAAKIARDLASSATRTSFGTQTKGHYSIQASTVTRGTRCSGYCVCICHQRSKTHSSPSLNRFFGTLFVGYTGVPRIVSPCDTRTCTQRSSLAVVVTYVFPKWFLARAMVLMMGLSSFKGPQLNIAFPRLVDNDSLLFDYIRQDDLTGVKRLFSQRIASPFDMDHRSGYTALMVSLY